MNEIKLKDFTTGGNFGDYSKFIPLPKSKTSMFAKVLDFVRSGVNTAAQGFSAIDGTYADLIGQQMELQKQMMLVSMQSNISRTEHETKMAAVRNIRVA